MKSYGTTVLLEKTDGTAIITINRPEAMNALNGEVLAELAAIFDELENALDTFHAVIITGGEGKAFVAGADVKDMPSLSLVEGREHSRKGQKLFKRIENFPRPVIAAINGFAFGGGCELAMCCDFRIAADTAKLGMPEVGLGIIPGYGGTARLPRLVGKGMAKFLLFRGATIDAQEALRIGLVQALAPKAELLDYCRGICAEIGQKSPFAVSQAKLAVNNGLEQNLDSACAYESELVCTVFSHPEGKEGLKAFIEKRKPDFNVK